MDWLRHTLSVGRVPGFNIELVTPVRIAELYPFYKLDSVLGALYTPDDGHVNPSGGGAGARDQHPPERRQEYLPLPGDQHYENGRQRVDCVDRTR